MLCLAMATNGLFITGTPKRILIIIIVKFMQDNYPPGFNYDDFAPMLKAELFDPDQWADIIEASGAKYVELFIKSS